MSNDTNTALGGQALRRQPSAEHVTIIKESDSGSGLGLITLLLVIASLIAVAFVWVGGRNKSDQAMVNASEAVTNASQSVEAAADKVGGVADRLTEDKQ